MHEHARGGRPVKSPKSRNEKNDLKEGIFRKVLSRSLGHPEPIVAENKKAPPPEGPVIRKIYINRSYEYLPLTRSMCQGCQVLPMFITLRGRLTPPLRGSR